MAKALLGILFSLGPTGGEVDNRELISFHYTSLLPGYISISALVGMFQMELLIFLHPDVRSLLISSPLFNVTPEFLLDSFIVHYSDNGTTLEAVMLNWSALILFLYGIASSLQMYAYMFHNFHDMLSVLYYTLMYNTKCT